MLESLVHERSAFVTLTYSEENLPAGGTLVPRHLQLFLKRLRKNAGFPIRFFGVGEYGDNTWRPHYHLALYGLDKDDEGLIHKSWTGDITDVGTLTHDSAQYIAGYIPKKMTKADDPRLQYGLHPEFARMSLRPGIGALAVADIASALTNKHGEQFIKDTGDVPNVLKHARRNMPLGRYMRNQLRKAMNLPEGASPDAIYKRSAELLTVYTNFLDASEVSPVTGKPLYHLGKQRKEAEDTQKAGQMMNKQKLYNSKKGTGI